MNYFNETEKSLKRYLKSKISITMATVVGFLIAGNISLAEVTTITNDTEVPINGAGNYNLGDNQVSLTNPKGSVISSNKAGEITVSLTEDQVLELNANGTGNQGVIYNTNITGNGTLILKNNGLGLGTGTNNIVANKVIIDVIGSSSKAISGYGNNSISAKEIEIKSTDDAIHFMGDANGKLNLENFDKLTIIGKGGYGIQNASSQEGSLINIEGNKNSMVTINGEGNSKSAIRVQGDNAQVSIEAGDVILNGYGSDKFGGYGGVINASRGNIELVAENNLIINCVKKFDENGNPIEFKDSGTAILGTGTGSINLNNTSSKVGNIIINGNIDLNDNSVLNANLTTRDSVINGNITTENTATSNILFANGATWNNKGNSSLSNLTMTDGVINNSVDGTINVGNFSGTGGTINAETKVNADGSLSTGVINIGSISEESKPTFDINFAGITADDVEKENVKIEGIITGATGVTTTGHVEEGLVNGAITVDKTGKVTQNNSTNTMDGLSNIAAINFLTWRQEMPSLNQRMGELRDSQGTSGVWARVYGGEFELDNRFKNKYQTYQVGYDKNYDYAGGKLFLGYLFSYTDGSTDYDLGSGDNNSFGAGVYGTWLNNSGHYIDVIAKINRLYNEYDVYSNGGIQSKGDYTNYGVSLSAEYGKRFTIDRVFIEPSVRMDLGKIGHESYTTSSGIRVDQDRMYTAQGALGAKIGYKLDKGNIYARLSGVKEFAGDIDMSYYKDKAFNTHSEDFEDEWLEFGIGGNYRVVESVNLYLDLAKTTDATVDTNWQANLGIGWEL